MILPPSLVAALPAGAASCPRARVLIVGTETVPAELIARWSRRLRVVVAYGLTEATVNSTLWLAEPDWTGPGADRRPGPQHPLLRARLRAAPGAGRRRPASCTSAAAASPAATSAGPALTARAVRRRPVRRAGRRGCTAPATGSRWRADGNLEFLGRADDQVQDPRVPDRARRGRERAAGATRPSRRPRSWSATDQRGGKRLVAYVVGRRRRRRAARRTSPRALPDYMVPSAVVALDGPLPLTPNGKLDRAALPEPDWTGAGRRRAPRPRRPSERSAGLFADVLGLPSVGVHDSFFELGGDSIVAIQLVNRARAAGLAITPRDVFRAPHGRRARRHRRPDGPPGASHDRARDRHGPADADRRAGCASLGGPIDAFYQSLLLRRCPTRTPRQVTAALQAVVDHHDLLRARLHPPTGRSRCRRPGRSRCSTRCCRRRRDVAVQAHGSPAAALDPAAGPDAAGGLVRRRAAPGRLLLVVHHLVVDGVSWRILADDLAGRRSPAATARPGGHVVPRAGPTPDCASSTRPPSCRSGGRSSTARSDRSATPAARPGRRRPPTRTAQDT